MKIFLPVLSRYARPGGVTQFLINFVSSIGDDEQMVKIYDYQSEVTNKKIAVNTFGKLTGVKRKVLLAWYVFRFSSLLRSFDHVLLNPSMGAKSMAREMYYAKKCLDADRMYSVFFHGWDWDYCEVLDSNEVLRKHYSSLISNAENVFVLAESFKEKLVEWGVEGNKIELEKTTVKDEFIPEDVQVRDVDMGIRILFLARITKNKGIFETLEAFEKHSKKYPASELNIAGVGEDLQRVIEFVKIRGLVNVKILGFADDTFKRQLLERNDVFILPSYTEGMPISILEAMAYGLTIVTRPVGGIPSFFDGNMGSMIESLDSDDFADALNSIVEDATLLEKRAGYNRKFVMENVASSIVTQRILKRICCD